MSYQLQHAYTPGRNVNGAELASCGHCTTLRVTLPTTEGPKTHYIRRGDVSEAVELVLGPRDALEGPPAPVERRRMAPVVVEPPCVSVPRFIKEPW